MTKQFLTNPVLQIFCKCQILPLTLAWRPFRVIMLKGPLITLIIGSRASKYENNLQEIMACESYLRQHFMDSVYFL